MQRMGREIAMEKQHAGRLKDVLLGVFIRVLAVCTREV